MGGVVAIAGGTTATILETNRDSTSTSDAEDAVVVGALFAGVGGVLALLAQYVADPTTALNERTTAVLALQAGLDATDAGAKTRAYQACILGRSAPGRSNLN